MVSTSRAGGAFLTACSSRLQARAPIPLNAWTGSPYDPDPVAAVDPFLGPLKRIGPPGENSFLEEMAVPTFSASARAPPANSVPSVAHKALGLEGVLGHGPAFVMHDVLSKDACHGMIETLDDHFGAFNAGKNHHGAMQIVVPKDITDALGAVLSRHVDTDEILERHLELLHGSTQGQLDVKDDVQFIYAGLNQRWRVYRYAPGGEERFSPHIDAGFPPSGLSEDGSKLIWDLTSTNNENDDSDEIVSRLTVLFYLNDDFVGGETNFYRPLVDHVGAGDPPVIAAVKPVAGSVLVFPQAVGEDAVHWARTHWPLHEGSPVQSGRPKYVIRSDIMFATEKNPRSEDELYRYDHIVRGAFLPTSPPLDQRFLHHLSSLYNPHMGVENIGPFLYSFLRFTKMRRVVEIGAGYTSVWILQALKDNDDEMSRIRSIQEEGQCRLFDWPWAVPPIVTNFDATRASLLCIDNCLHQKETATGAAAVAKTLGLDSYMQFLRGDAFELELKENSVDVLWCDFGVGDRISDFLRSSWPSVRPGGFLLCHSTLTNQRTRDWLEAVRARAPEDVTGMPPDGYVEISLLEPHKHYQNSVSIFQKRRDSAGKLFAEPVYSQYA